MDLERIGKEYEKSLSIQDRKILGSHYTKFTDAWKLTNEILSYIDTPITRVLEPSCGGGAFAVSIYYALKEKGIDGLHIINNILVCIDIDESAANITKKVLQTLEPLSTPVVHIDDTLLIIEKLGKFDIVIGNPPYVRIHNIPDETKAIYRNKFSTFRDKADLSTAFIEAGFDCLTDKGVLGYIISDSFSRSKSGQYIRSKIKDHLVLYDNRNSDGKFDASVAVTDIIVTKNHSTDILYNGDIIDYSWLGENEWIFEESTQINGKTLEELNISLSLGIVTGCNEALIGDFEECEWTRSIYGNKKKHKNMRVVIIPNDIPKPKWVEENLGKYKDVLTERVAARLKKSGVFERHLNQFNKDDEICWWSLQGPAFNIDWSKDNWIIKRIGSTFDDFVKIPSDMVCLDTSYVLQTPSVIDVDILVNVLKTCPKIHNQLEQMMNKIGNKYEIHANKFKRIIIPDEHLKTIFKSSNIFQ